MSDDEVGRRLFNPDTDRCYNRIPGGDLVVYNAEKEVSQLQFSSIAKPTPSIDKHTVVIYIDGACRNNGTKSARASYGIYFGPESKYNKHGLLDPSFPQTSSRAEIAAFAAALEIAKAIADGDISLMRFVFVTDSTYLVDAMTVHIPGWIENGGRKTDGKKVAHFGILRWLHERMNELEYGDDGGIECSFWYVPREKNTAADSLANMALDLES